MPARGMMAVIHYDDYTITFGSKKRSDFLRLGNSESQTVYG